MTVRREMRGPLWNLVKTFLRPPISLTWVGYLAWIAALTLVASSIDVWNEELVGDTVLAGAASFTLLFHSEQVLERDDFFRRKVARALRLTVVIEVYVNLVVLPLIVELALVPIVTFLAMTSAYAASDERLEPAKKLVDGLLTSIGFVLLAFVTVKLARDPSQLNETDGLRFLLPVWISLGVLPYIYLVALYAGYDSAFRRIS